MAEAELVLEPAPVVVVAAVDPVPLALLHPATRALGPVLISQLEGALLGAPLPASQSFILVWPQLTGLVATTIVIFVIAYIVFQRQEIRA